jgi:energy-coupling factor transporter ATP-binding protein EcfA2
VLQQVKTTPEQEAFTPPAIKTSQNPYNYETAFEFLKKIGIKNFGEKFTIEVTDKPIITKLIAYFLKDESMCLQHNISLQKGILLSGPIGCGKTTLMHLMKYFNNQNQSIYELKSCRDIGFEFIKEGYDIINRYSKQSYYRNGNSEKPIHYCFDDLGTENNLKYYGNECNIMAEILLSRYDQFIAKKLITHITTNLSASEIEDIYGNRVRSRMRELFNLVGFEKSIKDKRV